MEALGGKFQNSLIQVHERLNASGEDVQISLNEISISFWKISGTVILALGSLVTSGPTMPSLIQRKRFPGHVLVCDKNQFQRNFSLIHGMVEISLNIAKNLLILLHFDYTVRL